MDQNDSGDIAVSLDVKQAVATARDYFTSLYSDDARQGVSLEEVELDDEESTWRVTLGYNPTPTEVKGLEAFRQAIDPEAMRKYKVFEINRHTGEVQSMKIRPVPHD